MCKMMLSTYKCHQSFLRKVVGFWIRGWGSSPTGDLTLDWIPPGTSVHRPSPCFFFRKKISSFVTASEADMDWVHPSLDWIGLDWVGLGQDFHRTLWIGFDWVE